MNDISIKNDDAMDVVKNILSMNKQHEMAVYNEIVTYIDRTWDEREQKLKEYFDDKLIKSEKRLQNEINAVSSTVGEVAEQSNITYKRTNTLSFTGKAKELSNKVKSVAFKHTGEKGSLEYILFYHKFINQVYKKLKDYYEVNSYTMIDCDSFDDCMRTVSKWRPKHNTKRMILKEYQKLDDKGLLSSVKSRALSDYLDEKGGEI